VLIRYPIFTKHTKYIFYSNLDMEIRFRI